MKRILVTGASGFVGGHLRAALRDAFPEAWLVAATHTTPVSGWDEALPVDLLSATSCAACLSAARPDAIVHLAAAASVGASFRDPLATWHANLFGTVTLAEQTLASAPAALFLHASSAEVYGLSFLSGHALTEDALLRPANPYAASKAATDLAIGELALRGLRTVRMRPFNHTGSGQSEEFVVSAFARQVAMIALGLHEPVLKVGALDRWRDFLDVKDVCAGYVAALGMADHLSDGAVFNLATGDPKHIGKMLDHLLDLAGITAQIQAEPGRLRRTDVVRTAGDATAARTVLGWSPKVPWRETLAAVLDYWTGRLKAGS